MTLRQRWYYSVLRLCACWDVSYFEHFIEDECSCFIEFIERVEEKRNDARLDEHFIVFSQTV